MTVAFYFGVMVTVILFAVMLLVLLWTSKWNIPAQSKTKPDLWFTSPWLILLIVPVLAVWVYMVFAQTHERKAWFALWQAQATHPDMNQLANDLLSGKADMRDVQQLSERMTQTDTVQLINVLQATAHQQKENAMLWQRLSQVYAQLHDRTATESSLAHAHRVAPENTKIAMQYAQTLFHTQHELTDEARRVLASILKDDPQHEGAQMLMGMGELRAGNLDEAYQWVVSLKQTLQAKQNNPQHVQNIAANVAQLDILLSTLAQQQSQRDRGVSTMIKLAPAIREELAVLVKNNPKAAVFVSAYAKNDQHVPYAVQRVPVSSLVTSEKEGFAVKLTDKDALLTSRTLSQAKRDRIALFLVAHISQSGNAIAQAGDLASANLPWVYAASTIEAPTDTQGITKHNIQNDSVHAQSMKSPVVELVIDHRM